MQSLLVVLVFSPALIDCFSLAFLRTSRIENPGINWITKEAITDAKSLEKCFPVPFEYFDIAQFMPDNATPELLTKYLVQKIYDPDDNLYWINVPDISVRKVEFYTGTDCKNAVYQQDEESALRMSRARTMQRNPAAVRPPTMQLPQNIPVIAEEEEDEDYYQDFDIDMTESDNIDQQVERQPATVNLGTTVQEKMDIEPPVAGETQQDEISRQERNFLRFYNDVESDGGIALDSRFTTLQWSDNWKSFKFSYMPTTGSRVTDMRNRDL